MQVQRNNRCPVCTEGELKEVTGDFETEFTKTNGDQMQLTVPNVSWRHCDDCGEDLLDDTASKKITKAHRSALGLLTEDEIRSIRTGLGKTQTQMSELLGIGEKTYCRWESGSHFQSEAFDRYLRLLMLLPQSVLVLGEIRRDKENDPELSLSAFRYLPNPRRYEITSKRFTELLFVGPFQLVEGT